MGSTGNHSLERPKERKQLKEFYIPDKWKNKQINTWTGHKNIHVKDRLTYMGRGEKKEIYSTKNILGCNRKTNMGRTGRRKTEIQTYIDKPEKQNGKDMGRTEKNTWAVQKPYMSRGKQHT